jgi:hypothetical protein
MSLAYVLFERMQNHLALSAIIRNSSKKKRVIKERQVALREGGIYTYSFAPRRCVCGVGFEGVVYEFFEQTETGCAISVYMRLTQGDFRTT